MKKLVILNDNRIGHSLLSMVACNAMNVSLTPELEMLVTRKVQSGLYQSASEVVREGLRLLEEQDCLRELHLDEVRKKIQAGLDQLDRGEGIPGDLVYADMKKRSAEFRKTGR
jgi:antitoxin ParD1/3/4